MSDAPNAADWVSAGAAAVQAVGAVIAIWFTAKLAREAAQREVAAEAASIERERQAIAAAEQREREAEDRAVQRALLAGYAEVNGFIFDVRSVVQAEVDDLEADAAHFEELHAKGDKTHYGTALTTEKTAVRLTELGALAVKSPNSAISRLLVEIEAQIVARGSLSSPAGEVAVRLREKAERIKACLPKLDAARSGPKENDGQ